ncbi:hypothetical protein N9B05_06365, partial [Mariniblastus sp.]|nr:hypothetical protein [Mariniblastus sp.]
MSQIKPKSIRQVRAQWDGLFWTTMSVFGVFYLALIIAMLVADFRFTNWSDMTSLLSDARVRFSIWLSLISCTIAAILSLWVAIPTGFLL